MPRMTTARFADDLARFGPSAFLAEPPSLAESRAYCAALARRHYENFTVASWLIPLEIRPHFYSIYAYCRWADDLADETPQGDEALALLDWWQGQLDACFAGQAEHPVFIALRDTIERFEIPREPFAELLIAFRQDQHVRDYDSRAALLDYCRHSANPVGRLLLYLGRCHDDRRVAWSDSICTGLQLVNFWQDVARDAVLGRIYLPQETRNSFHCDDRPWRERRATPEFQAALRWEAARTAELFEAGRPLIDHVPGWLSGDVWLFIEAGLKLLTRIERLDFDVWRERPRLNRLDKLMLLVRYLLRRRGGTA